MKETIISNGLIVTEKKQFKADIRIIGEKIKEIGSSLKKINNSTKVIDAQGLTILPGGIDPHVHLSLPGYVPEKYRWADDFESGSKAALAGGITSMGCISVPDKQELPLGTIARETEKAEKKLIADLFIHPVIQNPTNETIKQLSKLPEKGCTSIKVFMVTDDFEQHSREYLELLYTAKKTNLITMIHCEDNNIIKTTCEKMIKNGKGSLENYADSRPVISEVVATQRAVAMCEVTKAPMYIVHLSSKRALDVCSEAQERQLPVFVEGRPIFFYYTREKYQDDDGPLYVVQPPLREKEDLESLWKGLQNSKITTLATDHAPHMKEHKLDPTLNVANLLPGINELQTMLPMFYTKAVQTKKISLKKFVALTSTNAAHLFGLYPRKGTIQEGADADLVLWDFSEKREIKDEDMFSQAGFSIYHGMKTTGWPHVTIRRGEIVYEEGKIFSKAGSGKVLFCKQPQIIK
ncbi:MAG: amidohydrolase family protein [Asgard group archaeon]|nr:amidohydrolase family protein [Asgard group archaeon]